MFKVTNLYVLFIYRIRPDYRVCTSVSDLHCVFQTTQNFSYNWQKNVWETVNPQVVVWLGNIKLQRIVFFFLKINRRVQVSCTQLFHSKVFLFLSSLIYNSKSRFSFREKEILTHPPPLLTIDRRDTRTPLDYSLNLRSSLTVWNNIRIKYINILITVCTSIIYNWNRISKLITFMFCVCFFIVTVCVSSYSIIVVYVHIRRDTVFNLTRVFGTEVV